MDRYTSAQLYEALAVAETGGEADAFVRTRVNASMGGSTAYGPVQMTGTLVRDFLRNHTDLFDAVELEYIQRFLQQSALFARHGNMRGKLDDYDARYDYGGPGCLAESGQDRRLYRLVAERIIGYCYGVAEFDLDRFIRRWRGVAEPEDPRYYAAVHKKLETL